ncbi:hypothetical protein DSM19430T_29680 [Desulfovibrio psychrotolerans]|uniref:Uncharacterized protein n=1 Tax=Desulfovibrio psychrotolerans TaxID=415242 RepID=A0A7J0BZ84_9BACT|nr:hypothetical protein DSM19430T_29680 [Desulfovibrio psychrotolerans]
MGMVISPGLHCSCYDLSQAGKGQQEQDEQAAIDKPQGEVAYNVERGKEWCALHGLSFVV